MSGSRGPLSKPAEMQRLPAVEWEPPEAQERWLPGTAEAWRAYWASDVSNVCQEVDVQAVIRLFDYYDERERAFETFREERVTSGSRGQQRISPLGKYVLDLDARISALEDRLGITPMARMRLGIAVGEATRSLAEVNRRLDAGDAGQELDARRRRAALDVWVEGRALDRG